TDQGRQFKSQLFTSLARLCGIHLSRTTAHHPAANRLAERFHLTLKAAIMCHADQQWTEVLPLVLLGIRTAFKEDLQALVAELMYGEPLRVPSELLIPTTKPADAAQLIIELRQHMARLRPIPASRHASPATFMHRDLGNCTHVFLQQDAARRVLETPYRGPYQVLTRRDKTMQILVHDRPVTVSTDRVKPAYMLNESSHGAHTTFNPTTIAPALPATPPQLAAKSTRCGRQIASLLASTAEQTSPRGGDVGASPQHLADNRHPFQKVPNRQL
ncbi:hypothetical protein B7P43_G16401, partial [Cryptotermes secundus]